MKSGLKIIEIPFNELTKLNTYFKRHSGIDMSDIPEKYGDSIINAKNLIEKSLKAFVVYTYADIDRMDADSVVLTTGENFTGKIPPLILQNSSKVFCFVASLKGYAQLEKQVEDTMENYFLDTWGTAYIENAVEWIKDMLRYQLAIKHLKPTNLWSPGQYQFDLVNQRALFQLLKPESIGCSLEKSCKMNPLKTLSGIIGVISEDIVNTLLPCDFCSLSNNCAGSKKSEGCY